MYYVRNKLRDYVFNYRNKIGKLQDNGRYMQRPSWAGDRLTLIWDLGTRQFTSQITYHWCKSSRRVYLDVNIWQDIDTMYRNFKKAHSEQLGYDLID